jgi:hypothetical protein
VGTIQAARSRWRQLASRAAQTQSEILLFLLYFLAFLPIALVRRPFSDPLGVKPPGGWKPRRAGEVTLDAARRQF